MEENLARQAELAFERQGDYDTLCYEGAWHTSGQMADRGSRLGTGLAGLGVRPGDRLLVLMANCPEVLITYTAAWRAGAVVTPLIFLASEDELRHALNDSGAVGVVTTVEFLPKVSAALSGAPGVRFVLVPGAGSAAEAAPGVPVLDFDQVASAEPGSIADRSGSDLAALLYTGGTTGRSKGVPLTHAGLLWCGSAAHEQSVRSNVSSSVLPLPLAHAYGLLVICGGMHRTDHTRTILMRWFDPAGWVKLAAEHKVQGSALVPSMIQMLLGQPLEDADLSEPGRDLVRGGAAGRGGSARVRGAGPQRDRLRGLRVYRGGHVHLGQPVGRAAARQRRAAGARRRAHHPGRGGPGASGGPGRRDLRAVPRRDDRLLA